MDILTSYHPFLYLNFWLSSLKPLCSYGPDNVAFLKSTAKKYDPDGVFQKLAAGGFKVKSAC